MQLIFSLRFKSQLRRTRPALVRELEKSIIDALSGYGGTVKVEHKLITAAFNRNTIGFWLDIFCLLESIKTMLEKASSELYGHVCIVSEKFPGTDTQNLVRILPSTPKGTGIWCAREIMEALKPYIGFDEAFFNGDESDGVYYQVKTIKYLEDAEEIQTIEKNNSEKIRSYLKQGPGRNAIIVGEERIGKLEGLYRYCEEQMKGFPPLLVRFRDGANTLTSFADAFSPEIKKLLDEKTVLNLEKLAAELFQERLRDELSDFSLRRGKYFFAALLDAYKAAAEKHSVKPMMILDNVQDSTPGAKLFVTETNNAYAARDRIKIFGTATKLKVIESWEELFPRIIKFTPEKTKPPSRRAVPPDIREMGYCCELLKRYFPAHVLPQLLKEEGKHPLMIEKTLAILSRLQSVERFDFIKHSGEIPGSEAGTIRALVRRRLLACVREGRLKPCFPLLKAFVDLDERADINLILDVIDADLTGGTSTTMEKAVENDTFTDIAGSGGAANDKALISIVKTQKALNYGSREETVAAFKDSSIPGKSAAAVRVRMLANTASYYLGIGDIHAAEDAVKEAMLLTQNENSGRGLARIYRLFSLVALANHKLSDAIDYFSFAAEHAEKDGDKAELSISLYYAAVAHFIFGNIFRAMQLARDAQKAALEAILPGWADRSRFLEGRLFFETGLYRKASDVFNDLKENHAENGTEEFEQTLTAWIYRTNVYLRAAGQNQAAAEELERKSSDAVLFEVEAAFISGDYHKTLELIQNLEQEGGEERFVMIEQPDWRGGFYQCELLLFPRKDLWKRMMHSFRALSLCQVGNGGAMHERDEAIREMQQIIRNELPEADPNDTLYLYSYYLVLKLSGAPDVDLNTAISLGFKRLQKRASRIEDNETKRAFLFTHYWNSALTSAAKEHKLI